MNDKSYSSAMKLFNYVNDGDVSQKKLERLWHDVFEAVLSEFGFPKRCIAFLWEELVKGNWNRLHFTSDEKSFSQEEWLDSFKWEVFYFSDRWSLDRLARAHWLFRSYRGDWAPSASAVDADSDAADPQIDVDEINAVFDIDECRRILCVKDNRIAELETLSHELYGNLCASVPSCMACWYSYEGVCTLKPKLTELGIV